jgi:hypothetical protein
MEVVHCIGCGKTIRESTLEDGDPKVCLECWKCPCCGTGVESEDNAEGLIYDEYDRLLHCYNCQHGFTVRKFEAAVRKKGQMMPCPHCKGKGLVPKKGK